MQRIYNRATILIIAILASVSLLPVDSYAQSTGAAQGIQLSPSIIELNAERGGIYTLTVEVTNITAGDLDYAVSVNDFTSKDETGSPKVLRDSRLPKQISVRTWVTPSVSEFHLDARKNKTVEFRVVVPMDAEPGGHYGVLDFSGSDTSIKRTGVGLTASAGTLLLVKVDGIIEEDASVASFYAVNNGKESNFFENSPVSFITRVENTGNIHIKPFGTIVLKNMFGSVVASIPVNKAQSNVLPGSIRRFDNVYDGYMIGHYTATVTLGYGSQGQVIMASTSFWVIPYKLIVTILLVVSLMIFILRRIQIAYNKRVIKKYKNAQQKNDTEENKN